MSLRSGCFSASLMGSGLNKPHSAGSVQFVKAADPEKQTLLRLDPLIQHRTKGFAITLNTSWEGPGVGGVKVNRRIGLLYPS